MHELLDVSCLPNFTAQLHLNLYLLFTLWALKKHYTIQKTMQQQALTADFQLSQIVLVPTSDWDVASLGLGNRYDV